MAILEKHMRVYDEDCYVEVKPDADGLDLIEINHVEYVGKDKHIRGFAITKDVAVLLAKALEHVLKE